MPSMTTSVLHTSVEKCRASASSASLAYCRAARPSARERTMSMPNAMPRTAIASRLGRTGDLAEKQPLQRLQDDVQGGEQQQAGFDKRRKILDFAVAVGMIGIGRPVGNAHRQIGDDRGDQVQARMQRLGEHSQAARGHRQKNLQRHQHHGRADRGERRHLFHRAGTGFGDDEILSTGKSPLSFRQLPCRLYDGVRQGASRRGAVSRPPIIARTCSAGYCSGGGGTSGKRRGSPCGPCTSTSSNSNDGAITSVGTPPSAEPNAPSAVPAISASWLCSNAKTVGSLPMPSRVAQGANGEAGKQRAAHQFLVPVVHVDAIDQQRQAVAVGRARGQHPEPVGKLVLARAGDHRIIHLRGSAGPTSVRSACRLRGISCAGRPAIGRRWP